MTTAESLRGCAHGYRSFGSAGPKGADARIRNGVAARTRSLECHARLLVVAWPRPCYGRARQRRSAACGRHHAHTARYRNHAAPRPRRDPRLVGGRRRLCVPVREGVVVPRERPGDLRELPRHGRPLLGVAGGTAPPRRDVQRLPHSGRTDLEVRREGPERLPPLDGVHARRLPGGHPGAAREQARGRGQLPPVPPRPRGGHRARPRHVLRPLPCLRRPPPLTYLSRCIARKEHLMSPDPQPRKNGLLIALVAGIFALVAVGAAALLVNISERKSEARHAFVKVVDVTENDTDPGKWGKNWPREYDDYKATAQRTATKYGGGSGTAEGEMPPEKADRDPWLKRVFAGYLFAVDYRDRRGHAYMLNDQEVTKRNVPGQGKQSGNCLHCHASIIPLYKKLGKEAAPQASEAEQVQAGLVKVGELDYWDAYKQLGELAGQGGKPHPVSCVDCHDPQSMELRVTRPGFMAGIQKLAASQADVPHLPSIDRWRKTDRKKPYDPNLDSTRQEKRAYVCGQCHVEYFCGKGQTIFFPWAEGLK